MKVVKPICYSFIDQSIVTWNRLEFSNENDMGLSEDSITDFNLLELQFLHPLEIRTQKHSNVKEGKTGADWEWWLGSDDNWLGFRIQAKKLDIEKMEYAELDRSNKIRGRQVDLLIKDAFDNDPPLIPLYVFYNNWDTFKFTPTWNCKIDHNCIDILGSESLFGCGLSYAGNVREALDNRGKKLHDLIEIIYPWSCLICCPDYQNNHRNLPYNAFNFVKKVFKDEFVYDNISDKRFIRKGAPDHVNKIIKGSTLSEEEWDVLKVNRITVIYQKDIFPKNIYFEI